MDRILQRFCADVDAFLEETGMKPVTFGKKAVNSPSFYARLKAGDKSMTTKSLDRAYKFMETHRYGDLEKYKKEN